VTDFAAGQPAMIDWESVATAASVVTLGQAVADCAKRDPLIYYGYAQLAQASPDLSRWPLMLPAYPRGNMPGRYSTLVELAPRLPPGRASEWRGAARPYDFHQYTPAGRVAGIVGPVDRSVWIGTAADLQAWHASGALPATNAPVAPSS
jgi:GH25 family lysozyme M1 (1,4-beta-N-acetylmuramidase)